MAEVSLREVFSRAQNDQAVEAQQALSALQQEIQAHRAADKNRSYLDKAFDFLWRSDEKSLKRLQNLEFDMRRDLATGDVAAASRRRDEVSTAIQKDQKAVKLQNDISFYGSTGLKVGALFVSGPYGWAATAGFYMLDQAKPKDSVGKQLVDAGLGAAKGLAFKGLLNGVLSSGWNIALKGGAMSLGGRALETALTSENYYDKKAGGYSLVTGLRATGGELTNLEHLAVDAVVMGVAFGVGYGLNHVTGGALRASPFYSRIATSGVAGLSRGAMMEVSAARAAGEAFSLQRIGTRAVLMGTVYSLAAVPGAWQADAAARHAHDQSDKNVVTDQEAVPDQQSFHEYRKVGTVRAEQLTQPTDWTTSKGEVMHAEAGDWKITGPDGSTWSVKPDIFAKTYSAVPGSSGEFAKTAITRAIKLTQPVTIQTLEGQGSGEVGDYLVVGPQGEQYIVPGAKFEAMYRPADQPSPAPGKDS